MRRRTRHTLRTLARRTLLWLVLPLAILLAVRLLWGWESARRMTRVKNELRALGVRFEPATLHVPDDQNPRLALAKAAELALPGLSAEENKLLEGDPPGDWADRAWTDAEKTRVQTILNRYQEAFRWIDEAARRTGPMSPVGSDYAEHLAQWRMLGRLLYLEAVLEHGKGHDVDTLHDLQRIHVMADAADHGGWLIDTLIATALRALLSEGVERTALILDLKAFDGSRASAEKILTILQDPAPLAAPAWNYETEVGRMSELAATSVKLNAWWIRPLRDDDVARSIRGAARNVPGMRSTDWPASQRLLTAIPPRHAEKNLDVLTFWDSASDIACDKVMTFHFRGQAAMKAVAVLLACRLYEIDHARVPEALVDLVPRYLVALPTDPFSPTNAPMRFRMDPDGPTVWSVGENLSDEGAPVRFDAAGIRLRRFDNRNPLCQPDIVYGAAWINAKPPPPASTATMPVPRL
jgi:hypothetical protein